MLSMILVKQMAFYGNKQDIFEEIPDMEIANLFLAHYHVSTISKIEIHILATSKRKQTIYSRLWQHKD